MTKYFYIFSRYIYILSLQSQEVAEVNRTDNSYVVRSIVDVVPDGSEKFIVKFNVLFSGTIPKGECSSLTWSSKFVFVPVLTL